MQAQRKVFFLLLFLLILVVLEGTAKVVYAVREGGYVSTAELFARNSNEFIRDLERPEDDCTYLDTLYPHPYLAFVHHDTPPCGIRSQLNSQGLFGEELPLQRDPEYFTILLTGGSVGAQLGQVNNPGSPKHLEVSLNARYRSPTGKPFRVFNGGDGAWKYPQQLILFAIYGPFVDGLVTLDGYNEHSGVRFGSRDRIEKPANNFIEVNPLANYSVDALGGAWAVNRLRSVIRGTPVVKRSHLAYLLFQAARGAWATALADVDDPLRQRQASMFTLPAEWDAEQAWQWNVERYADYIRSMETMGSRLGVKTAFFIQPAPAFGKVLTDEEAAVVGPLDYADSYVAMTGHLLALRSETINIFSLLTLLEEVADTIYADHIHFERAGRGYTLMAERMATDIATAWQLDAHDPAADTE